MNKLLLGSAVAVLALSAAPAFAQDDSTLKLNLGGHFKGYVNYTNQGDDFTAGTDVRDFDILRQTEVHFGGETTLDNGLTVGAQIEATAETDAPFLIDESYVYLAGSWGRVNFGDEDGAAYLLQVAAPSADDNVDGIRQFINPINYGGGVLSGLAVGSTYTGGLDYDNDIAGNADKITYLSPVFSGFQAGLSYSPESNDVSRGGNGNALDDQAGDVSDIWEAALRYEGSFNNVGMILGGGYTHGSAEEDGAPGTTDDIDEWNLGADFDIGAFGLGVIYTETNTDLVGAGDNEAKTWVVGGDYTTGPFKLGASWLTSDIDVTGGSLDADRYTGGVVYTYGPGMSFRGSVSYADFDGSTGIGDVDATSVLLGTQISF